MLSKWISKMKTFFPQRCWVSFNRMFCYIINLFHTKEKDYFIRLIKLQIKTFLKEKKSYYNIYVSHLDSGIMQWNSSAESFNEVQLTTFFTGFYNRFHRQCMSLHLVLSKLSIKGFSGTCCATHTLFVQYASCLCRKYYEVSFPLWLLNHHRYYAADVNTQRHIKQQ